MKRGYNKRFLLFDDDVCVGLFNERDERYARASSAAVILSADANFAYIRKDESEFRQHHTCFCPTNVVDKLRDLLAFRNSHVKIPYFCERFNEDVGFSSKNSATFTDASSELQDFHGFEEQSMVDLSNAEEALSSMWIIRIQLAQIINKTK